MRHSIFLIMFCTLLTGMIISCGNDDNITGFENDNQGTAENVKHLRKAMNGEFEYNDSILNDSVVEGGDAGTIYIFGDKFRSFYIGEDGHLKWEVFEYPAPEDSLNIFHSPEGKVLTGKLWAVARVESSCKDFDNQKCFCISRYAEDVAIVHAHPDRFKDAIGEEAHRFYGIVPANATSKNFKVGNDVRFTIKKIMPVYEWNFWCEGECRYYVEIEIVE